ncbi:uncharacterized protein ColSpa_04977 [Colletotrichum spaethianum]|uniref:N-acetyltransferase domain-containing protein n=1 Tax=Colletotrichum spaethianum TaxID=700344 RepID=A0AA37P5V8_9PEZI|nr:uncharacterized protein ColSpa_04977 [Colletotrichum spaethianum]GKT44796.1 hypothetical protein ColSpa_04977 [Colletotrichum spaethianum]
MTNEDVSRKSALVSLSAVQADDISSLLKVHTAAFKPDQFSNLMLLNRDENAHQELMAKSIQRWMSDPTAKLTKALDANGKLVGWSCWILKTKYEEGTMPAPRSESNTRPSNAEAGQAKPEPPAAQKKEEQSAPPDPARVLGGLMYKDMTSWEEKHLKGKNYMVLQALATDPSHQRQGIATKLVQHGLEEVNSQGLPCWIHASPTSYTLYEKAGFEEVGRSDYDLDEWAPGEREETEVGEGTHSDT